MLKTYPESLFPDGSGHLFNFCPSGLESSNTDPRGFAVAETGYAIYIYTFFI
jgi:hypothetical protein